MKTVKKKTVRQGTRRMINAQAVTPYGLLTYRGGETAFFLLRPTCISVLPEDALAARVGALVTLFKSQPELEILCLNSRESFANNTRYLEARIGEEENPYIADLLEKDKAHLGSVQLQTATAREFVLAVRLEDVREKEKYRIHPGVHEAGEEERVLPAAGQPECRGFSAAGGGGTDKAAVQHPGVPVPVPSGNCGRGKIPGSAAAGRM